MPTISPSKAALIQKEPSPLSETITGLFLGSSFFTSLISFF